MFADYAENSKIPLTEKEENVKKRKLNKETIDILTANSIFFQKKRLWTRAYFFRYNETFMPFLKLEVVGGRLTSMKDLPSNKPLLTSEKENLAWNKNTINL